ncbi:LOW QUALITY PROTEIN: hypothetical protein PHMEG_00012808 [Phytophthora megakarya]|uniref:Uncharacterized protein n=1 Tax=Phytophthora megakarya TaxID=4795 RepID=A0A225W8A7_9STRA|nr:LOW QUALITY PROTEIN: hypothetical protein PHMEG_00012808 [Phytophthora megakarya]
MADAGSRAWSKSHSLWQTWTNMSCSWSHKFSLPSTISPPYEATLCGTALAKTSKTKYNSHWSQWTRFSTSMGWSPGLTTVEHSSSNKLRHRLDTVTSIAAGSPRRETCIRFHSEELSVTPAFLRLLRRSLNLVRPQERLVWGSILLAYFFLLRRFEYLMVGRNRAFYCLKPKDAFFTNSREIPVAPESATAATIGLSGANNDKFDRVRTLKHILQARRDLGVVSHGYLCVDHTAEKVSSALKATAIRAGVETSRTHHIH